jgi:hypothetical protein
LDIIFPSLLPVPSIHGNNSLPDSNLNQPSSRIEHCSTSFETSSKSIPQLSPISLFGHPKKKPPRKGGIKKIENISLIQLILSPKISTSPSISQSPEDEKKNEEDVKKGLKKISFGYPLLN